MPVRHDVSISMHERRSQHTDGRRAAGIVHYEGPTVTGPLAGIVNLMNQDKRTLHFRATFVMTIPIRLHVDVSLAIVGNFFPTLRTGVA